MDLYKVFSEISEQLLSEFRKSAEIKHPGGKGVYREDAFSLFLKDYLPKNYGVGKGEVITSQNQVSGELDIIIYDPNHAPCLIKSSSHSVYPEESVFGAISMKSNLNSNELKDAYSNIVSFKKILSDKPFNYSPMSGVAAGYASPIPVTGIVAFSADRNLETISNQVRKLDKGLSNIKLRPDFVAILGKGIIGAREGLRRGFNFIKYPDKNEKLTELRQTGRHTLLRLYIQIIQELNFIKLPPLDLKNYLNMPRLIGKYRVKNATLFILESNDEQIKKVKKISHHAIDKIVKKSNLITMKQHYFNVCNQIPPGANRLDNTIYEYNPLKLPPLTTAKCNLTKSGKYVFSKPVFQPVYIEIDGKRYAVDFSSFKEEDFDDNEDFSVLELMSL